MDSITFFQKKGQHRPIHMLVILFLLGLCLFAVVMIVLKLKPASSSVLNLANSKPCDYTDYDLFDFRKDIVNYALSTCFNDAEEAIVVFEEFTRCWEQGRIKYLDKDSGHQDYALYEQALNDVFCAARSAFDIKAHNLSLEKDMLEENDESTSDINDEIEMLNDKLADYNHIYFIPQFGDYRSDNDFICGDKSLNCNCGTTGTCAGSCSVSMADPAKYKAGTGISSCVEGFKPK